MVGNDMRNVQYFVFLMLRMGFHSGSLIAETY